MDDTSRIRQELPAEDRRIIAETAQRFVNARVFRQMSEIIREWQEEEASRSRAAKLLLALSAVAVVIGAAIIFVWKH